ncbi:MAG: tetratricopeptide repeat protein [Pseudomonadota bacterium]
MSTRFRLNAAISALALASMLSACAGNGGSGRIAKASDYRNKSVNTGLATRAVAALNANDTAGAIDLAERAVAQTPTDAGFRALLGNAYFAAGRFASAEQSFKDSLSLYPQQPQVMLKLALVEIAQGKTSDALAFLDFARSALDPADYGLALALAGRPADAIPVLREAAGSTRSDARVRQNLALAYALAGDWVNSRIVASQDVSPRELDDRIQGWMQFANGSKPAQQVAALVGVTPAAVDPGEPVQLALVKPDAQMAAAPAQAPVPVAQSALVPAPEPYYAPPPLPAVDAPAPEPAPAVEVAAAAPQPAIGSLSVKLPPLPPVAEARPAIVEASPTYVAPPLPVQDFPYVEVKRHAKKVKPVIASAPAARLPLHRAMLRTGKSGTVVQLGAYRSPQAVSAAWSRLTKSYPALRAHLPVRARFVSPKGTFWRLSIGGFDNPGQAIARCQLLQRRGGKCFVRGIAGDRPVEIASR